MSKKRTELYTKCEICEGTGQILTENLSGTIDCPLCDTLRVVKSGASAEQLQALFDRIQGYRAVLVRDAGDEPAHTIKITVAVTVDKKWDLQDVQDTMTGDLLAIGWDLYDAELVETK